MALVWQGMHLTVLVAAFVACIALHMLDLQPKMCNVVLHVSCRTAGHKSGRSFQRSGRHQPYIVMRNLVWSAEHCMSLVLHEVSTNTGQQHVCT